MVTRLFALLMATILMTGVTFGEVVPISYQGRLSEAGVPAAGSFTIRFAVYDSAADGAGTLLATVTNTPVVVNEGLFQTLLNFDSSVFNGGDRWLEIGVRPELSGGAFTILSPRQRLASTSYAVHAKTAETVGGKPPIVASINVNFSLDDRSGWTQIDNLGDDSVITNIPLGFTYTGFEVSTSAISLSSNGVLFFGTNAALSWVNWHNGTLPSDISTNAVLFFFWDDLTHTHTNAFAQYATLGSPGGRVFNLLYKSQIRADCSTNIFNTLISIHEGSNLIKVSYSGLTSCAAMRGANATIGFQTPGGAAATPFIIGYNSPVLDDNSSNQTISFHPFH